MTGGAGNSALPVSSAPAQFCVVHRERANFRNPSGKSQKPITRLEMLGFGFGGLMSAITYILLFTAVLLPNTARAEAPGVAQGPLSPLPAPYPQ